MLYLAFIFHMHQPYYKDLLSLRTDLPWVRLHGTKDYLDMVEILKDHPLIKQTFNLVPSLIEQVQDYTNGNIKDKFLELSYKNANDLTPQEKTFILQNFFSINAERVIALFPRYYELYFKKRADREFNSQDFLDLQVFFNLAWIDPCLRQKYPELKYILSKARFFSEEDKQLVLGKHTEILEEIVPAYKRFADSGQIELTLSPYYHPILPLLYSTNLAKEANPKTVLPKIKFAYPQDAQAQVEEALGFFKKTFGINPKGMWPSEESVCEHILPMLIRSGLNWIVTDEGILFKSLKIKKRNTGLIYQPHRLSREEGELNIIFRDRNLSDLIGFQYHYWKTEDAVADLLGHLERIALVFKNRDILVTLAMDGENAWEYFPNDGHDFLNLLYQRLSESKSISTTTVSEYLEKFPAQRQIKRLAAGSWIYSEFGKWIGNPYKVRAWEYLARARKELEGLTDTNNIDMELALKQIHIAEGSDWFWWYGEDPEGEFDILFRMQLANFYTIIGKDIPDYLKTPLKIP
jgi:alpha-amylase/alpha-mannosidase (GH57 family)